MAEVNTGELDPTKIEGASTADVDTSSTYQSGTDLGNIQNQVTSEGTQEATFNARPGERNTTLEEENRQKMLASGELKADTPEQLAMEKINLFTYGVENPTFSAGISSDAFGDEVDGYKADIDNQLGDINAQLGGDGANIDGSAPTFKYYEDFAKDIEDSRKKNEDLYKESTANINADFANRMEDQKTSNRMLMGFNAKTLARMGALGTSTSGLSYLQQVDQSNQRELNKVTVAKQQALLAANQAYQDNDWTLLSAKMNENKLLTDQYNDVQQMIFEDKMKSADQLMEQARFGWELEDRAMAKMSQYIELGTELTEDNAEDIAKLEERAGVPPGTYEQLKAINEKATKVDKVQADLEFQQDVVDLLNKVPEGQSVKIGDTIYSGWKKEKDDIWKTTATDNNGNITAVTFDPSTGTWKTVGLGNIGSSKDGWKTVESDGKVWAWNANTNEIRPVTTTGGYINPTGFEGFDEWRMSIGQTTTRYDEGTMFESSHPGWDIAGAVGDPITAFMGGEVVNVNNSGLGSYGNFIEIRDSEGRIWQYSHLDSSSVQVGDIINPGQYIGGMGNTGEGIQTSYTLDANGNVIKTDGHKATPEEKAAGLGAHLDLRVKQQSQQLTSDSGGDDIITGLNQSSIQSIQSDIMQLDGITNIIQKAEYYNTIRNQVASNGKNALDWFDKLYPPSKYDMSNLKWGEIVGQMGMEEIRKLSDNEIIEIAVNSGATKAEIYDIFQKGFFLTDRLTGELKDQINAALDNK